MVVGSGDDAELERIESKCLLVNQAFFQYVAHHVIVRHTLRCVLPLLWAYFRLFCRACRKYIFKTALFVSGTYSDGTFRSTFGLKDLDQGIVARPQRQTLFGYRCPVAITLAKHQPPRKIRVVRNRQHLTISLALQIEGGMLHRNVIFRGNKVPTNVFSAMDGFAEDLLRWLDLQCKGDCQVQNGLNLSRSSSCSSGLIAVNPIQ